MLKMKEKVKNQNKRNQQNEKNEINQKIQERTKMFAHAIINTSRNPKKKNF